MDRVPPFGRVVHGFALLLTFAAFALFAISTLFAGVAGAEVATLDVLFDLDRNASTGCQVMTADGPVDGIDLRARTLFDVGPETVTSSTTANCVDEVADLFGAEVGVSSLPVAPWVATGGNGETGSHLIESHVPLAVFGSASSVRTYVTLSSMAGSDAVLVADGGGDLVVSLVSSAVPGLTLGGFLAVLAAAVGFRSRLGHRALGPAVAVLLSAALLFAAPMSRALLGEGVFRDWDSNALIAGDAAGDGAAGLDLLGFHAESDVAEGELWLRVDVAFGAPICLDWGFVDPGVGYQCTMNPPPDSGWGGAVALTFDDGPNLVTTPGVLATLRAHSIPATFFVVGSKLVTPAEQALALEIHQDPLFRLANHTVNHTRLTNATIPEVEYQLDEANARIRDAIGDPCYFPEYFRFPFGASNCDTMEEVRRRGHATAGVNIDPKDWCYASGGGTCSPAVSGGIPVEYQSDMVGFAVYRYQQVGGGIMLMHDVHPTTEAALPAIISGLEAAGATFVDLSDLAVFPNMNAWIDPPEAPACCTP